MIHPAPTGKIDPTLARGVLERIESLSPGSIHAAAAKDAGGRIRSVAVLSFPNTSYQTHLLIESPAALDGKVQKRVVGVIALDARRVDVVNSGGKYLEPVFGRPRRVQGKVVATDAARNTIVVDAAVPVHCRLTDDRQRASDFRVGDFVSFDAMDGASFELKD